jgi:hypothetical protein
LPDDSEVESDGIGAIDLGGAMVSASMNC